MARKKAEVTDVPEEVKDIEQPVADVADVEPAPEATSPKMNYVEPAVEPAYINVDKELEIAQLQIEHCEDYLNVQGADYKGYMRGKIKEWRLYKYKLRQYSIGNAPMPVRPELVKDY